MCAAMPSVCLRAEFLSPLTLFHTRTYTCAQFAITGGEPGGGSLRFLPTATTVEAARTMKTKRRHELHTNVLADWLGQHLEHLRPYLKPLLGGVTVVALVGVAAAVIINNQASRRGSSWADYYLALHERDASRLRSVAEAHPGTLTGLWARQSEGDLELARGIDALYWDRRQAKEALRRAKTCFTEVAEKASGYPELQARAWYGLAQAHESLSELPQAREYYDRVANATSAGVLGKLARERSEMLGDAAVERWYNWFANQNPKPPSSEGTSVGGAFPGLSDDLSKLPPGPDLAVPGAAAEPPEMGDSKQAEAPPEKLGAAAPTWTPPKPAAEPSPKESPSPAPAEPAAPTAKEPPGVPPAIAAPPEKSGLKDTPSAAPSKPSPQDGSRDR